MSCTAGQAHARGGRERAPQCLRAGRVVRGRHQGAHEVRCGVHEHARRPAGIAQDSTARCLPVATEVPAHQAHGGAVGPTRVAIHALEPDRPRRKRRVEVRSRREFAIRPVVLVPAAPEQPCAGRQACSEGAQAFDDFALVAGADEVGLHQREPESHQVRMSVDEPRHHRGALRIMDGKSRGPRHDFGAPPDGDDSPVAIPCQRLGSRVRTVQRVDARVDEHACARMRSDHAK